MSRALPGAAGSYRRFQILWAGQLLSGLGSGMTAFALGIYAFRLTGSVSSFSLMILSLFLPSTLLKPLGGVLADRCSRRSLIIVGDLGGAAALLLLLMLLGRVEPSLGQIAGVVALGSAFAALREPAYKASISDLLEEKEFSRGAALLQLAASAQHLLSPFVAGALMTFGSIGTVVFVDLATFGLAIVAALLISGLRAARSRSHLPAAKLLSELREGWWAVTGDRRVISVVLVISVVTLFVGYVQTLFPPMMLAVTTAGVLGLLHSLSATGMILTSVLLGIGLVRGSQERLLATGLLLGGLSLTFVGGSTSILVIGVAFFFFFVSLPLINTSAEVLVRTRIANGLQGRAWGVIGLLSQGGYILAYLSAGPLADKFFEPLLAPGAPLEHSLGTLIGAGLGRGIGLMLLLTGIALSAMAVPLVFARMPTGMASVTSSQIEEGTL